MVWWGRNEDAYKLNSALRGGLVLLAEEQKALAGLRSPGLNVMGDIGNLVGLEGRDRLEVDGLRPEPEELLRIDQVPIVR